MKRRCIVKWCERERATKFCEMHDRQWHRVDKRVCHRCNAPLYYLNRRDLGCRWCVETFIRLNEAYVLAMRAHLIHFKQFRNHVDGRCD